MALHPRPATASAALEAGEIDYWETRRSTSPRGWRRTQLTVMVTDPRGNQGGSAPNHLIPRSTTSGRARPSLYMVAQEQYLQAVIGNAKYYRTCPGIFMCGGLPYETAAGAASRPTSSGPGSS